MLRMLYKRVHFVKCHGQLLRFLWCLYVYFCKKKNLAIYASDIDGTLIMTIIYSTVLIFSSTKESVLTTLCIFRYLNCPIIPAVQLENWAAIMQQ